jgi:N6-adenosine-specific RNA methylase IME4
MTYQIIVADPPWGFDDGLKAMRRKVKRSAESQYRTMTAAQVANLPVKELADPAGCLLALWIPGSMLEDGLMVTRAWGFRMKQIFVWAKVKKNHHLEQDWNNGTRVGMGRLFRQSHEIALICTSGRSIYKKLKNKAQRSVAFDLNLGHSVKPPTLQRRLEKMFPDVDRLELFGRRQIAGWTVLGDGIDGRDIATSIQDLLDPNPSEGSSVFP